MSKALVIKGASFAANRVEQIVISQPVPCTGLTLSQNTITFTAIGQTQQLTATLTPADTTEALTWVSSNPDIISVSDTGLVTCIGVGTATITAMCGVQSASCAVTATHTINAATLKAGNGYQLATTNLSIGKDYCSVYPLAYSRVYATEVQADYHAFPFSTYTDLTSDAYPIKLPAGTKDIAVEYSDYFTNNCYICLLDSTTRNTDLPSSVATNECAKALTNITSMAKSGNVYSYQIPEEVNADSFVMHIRGASGTDASESTATVTITFSGE